MGQIQIIESVEEKYRSIGVSNNQYYQRKIQEYELFLDYIQINLKDIAEGKHKTQSIHAVFEEKMQHIVSQNTILADLYINMKHIINTITSKFKDAADLETKFLVELIQIILDKLSLSLEDRSLLEGKYFSILNSPLKEKKVSNQATLELKDILLKILQKENSWERRNVIQSPSPIKRQTTRTYPTEISLTLNVSKLSDNLAALSTNIVEKATMVKPILEKLNRFKNYLSRSNYDSRDRREGNSRSLLQGVITSLDELLTRNQRIMTSEARIIYEISLKLKEGIQNPNNEEVNLTEKVTNTFLESKELLSKCFEELNNIDKEYVEIKRSNTESDQGTGNSTLKTLTETKRELKNHTFDLLKEFYSEISGNFL